MDYTDKHTAERRVQAFLLGIVSLTLLCAICAAAFGAGRGQPVSQVGVSAGYKTSDVTAAYRTACDGGETFTDLEAVDTTDTSAAAITSISTAGFRNLTVSGHHSVASATVVVTAVGYYWDGTADGGLQAKVITEGTLTAEATYTSNSKYLSTAPLLVDTAGIHLWKVFVDDPSSGTVDVWVEVH